jgi:propionate CoA-transferase
MEYEPQTLDAFNRALAAKSSGGKTIVQVSRIARKGSLHPKSVKIPGNLVDAIVLQEHP